MISKIQITNLAKFHGTVEFETPSLCLINGRNSAGKSSLIKCLQYLAASGHDPDIIHVGQEWGEVVVTLDDGAQMRARAGKAGTDRGWKPKDGKRWIPNRELIESVCSALAYDALGFLDLNEHDQIEKFLEIMPIPFDQAEILEAVGEAAAEAQGCADVNGNALEVIASIEKQLTASRRTLNVAVDTQTKHAAQLEAALPPAAPDGTDWGAEVARLSKARTTVEKGLRANLAEISRAFESEKSAIRENYDGICRAIDQEIDSKIEALNAERFQRKSAAAANQTEAVEAARTKASEDAETASLYVTPDLERLTAEHATALERDRASQQAAGTRMAIDAARGEAAAKQERSEILTAALKRLTELKAKIASRLPIPGITIQDGRILRDEGGKLVPISRWNQSDQDLFCVRLGLLAYGEKAGLLCIDGFEKFDSARRTAFLKTCQRYTESKKMQFLIASVSDDKDLSVGAPAVGAAEVPK